MTNLRNVIVACLMVHFLKTREITPKSISGNVTETTTNNNNTEKGLFQDRSGTPYGPNFNYQTVYLYRGPNRPLEPYHYRPRTSRRHWQVPHGPNGIRKYRTETNKGKKQGKVRRDDQITERSNYEVAQTNNRPMRIRYDGKPFESIETMRETQAASVGDYESETSIPLEGNVQSKPNFLTLSGGVFDDSERNRRRHRMKSTASSDDVVRTGRRAEPSTNNNRNSRRQPKSSNTEGMTYDRHSHPMEHSSPLRNEEQFRVMDHYDGGFDKERRPEHSHGTDFDYESYELPNSGHYGYRTGPDMRRDKHVPSTESQHRYDPPSSHSDTRTRHRPPQPPPRPPPPPHSETRQPKQKSSSYPEANNESVGNRANYDGFQNSRRSSHRNDKNRPLKSNNKNQQQNRTSRRNPSNYSTASYSFVAETSSRPYRNQDYSGGIGRGRSSSSSPSPYGQYRYGTELVSDYDYSQNEQ